MSTVPAVSGLSIEDATTLLAQQGLAVSDARYEYSDGLPSGAVIDTSPPAGSESPDGGTVELIVSNGPDPVTGYVPDVAGVSYDYADVALTAAGYLPAPHDQESAFVEVGLVVGTVPRAGTALGPGASVNVYVSVGVPPIPDETQGPATVILE